MNLDELNAVNRRQICQAGARYTPGLDPDAPNLEVYDVALALAAVGGQETCRTHIRKLERAIRDRTRWLPRPIERRFRGRKFTPERVADALARLANSQPDGSEPFARELRRALPLVRNTLSRLQNLLYEKEQAVEKPEVRQSIRNELHDVRRLLSPILNVSEFLDSPHFALLTNNLMLLLGSWGTGKTHSLCDVTEHRMQQGLPTVLHLAHNLPYQHDPMQGLCDATGLASTPAELLEGLQRLGEATGSRALIIIDGINEGNRSRWKRSLAPIIRAVRQFTHVGVVLSCRQPFDQLIFTSRTRRSFVLVEHHGFTENGIDAQVEFFAYYDIPAPHAPLLTPEFSRPLFLKMFCESVRNRSVKSKSRYVRDLASGQKGMTRVLEDFAKEVGKPIEREYGLTRLACWRLLKGDAPSPGAPVIGIAPTMAQAMRDWISREECLALIDSFTSWASRERREEFLQRLLADGLLLEGIRWRDGEPIPVIQFPYQRFGDHLVARNLLEKHLRTETEAAIRRSFYVNRPLGRIFDLARGGYSYRMPGLASAIMLEFPERVKRALPSDDRELVAYLPRARQLAAPLRDVFLEGLYWRPADSFTKHTAQVINFYLNRSHEWTRDQVLEVLASLATRPGHPHSANRLHRMLGAQDMPERDLFWSEFVRRTDSTSAVQRLLDWIERTKDKPREPGVVENCVTLLSLCLTTTRRALRDRATRGLYLLGLGQPSILFDSTIASLAFNDPYVPERMLAASYGVAMSMWADPHGGAVRRELPRLARELVQRMFLARGRNRTAHVLMQDYALGIIELARRVAPRCVPRAHLSYLRRPLKRIRSPFPSPETISDEEAGRVKSALHMDFENYTLGQLVRNRGNYDYKHDEYQKVRRQILWRVANLGYSDERFATIDRLIVESYPGDRGPDPAKIDRYGKKYSWIAFFEMYGLRRDIGQLSELSGDRPSDVDIDPSFPGELRAWRPPPSGILEAAPSDLRAWLTCDMRPDYDGLLRRNELGGIPGPWVLLDGFIEESANTDRRRVFTFLWARFVGHSLVDDLVTAFRARHYPGNFEIPEPAQDVYTFAGEIPWSIRFASEMRAPTGAPVPHVEPAFVTYDGSERAGIPVEVPVHRWGWESYHSTMNQVGGVYYPASALCEALKLVNHARELDLYDEDGKRATLFVEAKPEDRWPDCHLLFIREDLINRYLTNAAKELVWFVWGERDVQPDAFPLVSGELSKVFQSHANIHRRAYVWDRRGRIVVR